MQPKYKVGDLVKLRGYAGRHIKGMIIEVIGIDLDHNLKHINRFDLEVIQSKRIYGKSYGIFYLLTDFETWKDYKFIEEYVEEVIAEAT